MFFFLNWLLSVTLTRLSRQYLSGKYHWYAVVAKDLVISSLVMGFILAAFGGASVSPSPPPLLPFPG